MKKHVVTFGLISGAVSSLMMWVTLPFIDRIGFDKTEVLGYTTIVLSLLLVFFGIRSYRDSSGGTITFGQGFTVGILITIVSCVCYVVTWEVLYFNFLHGFGDRYSAYMIEQVKASGASQNAIQAQLQGIKRYKELNENLFFNAAIAFIEPFPIGLIISLASAAILRNRGGKKLGQTGG